MDRCTIENCLSCPGEPTACIQCQQGHQLVNATCVVTNDVSGTAIPYVVSISLLASLGFILGLVVCMACVVAVVNCHLLHKRRGRYSVSRSSGSEDSMDELPDDHERNGNIVVVRCSTDTTGSAPSSLDLSRTSVTATTFDPIVTARSFVQHSTPVRVVLPAYYPHSSDTDAESQHLT